MSIITWRLLIGAFLIAHGLIYTSYAVPAPPPGPVPWPFDLTHSWLLSELGVGQGMLRFLGSVLWLATTLAFTVAGLGLFGLPGLYTGWRTMAILAAAFSLALLGFYWHPMLILGVAIDLGIFIALLWAHWPSVELVGA